MHMPVIEDVEVQVLKAWYCDQPILILPSQDVWSVGVMVLALLSPTPLTQQFTGIPDSDVLGRCKHAFQETCVFQNLDMHARAGSGRHCAAQWRPGCGGGDAAAGGPAAAVLQRRSIQAAERGRARAGGTAAADAANTTGAIIAQHIDPVCCRRLVQYYLRGMPE
jgi:hypothetical protein